MQQQPIVERAFQLAASGRFANTTQLKHQLNAEGYTVFEIGTALWGQHMQTKLMATIKAARAAANAS